jgi:hypothetical protein
MDEGRVRFADDGGSVEDVPHEHPPSPPPPRNVSPITSSTRSLNETQTSIITTPKKPLQAKELRSNLMREQVGRDPLFYYEVVSVLGVGSMGSVAKVKKRDSVIGGSARKDLQRHFKKEKKLNECFRMPLLGGFFQYCLKGQLKHRSRVLSRSDSVGSTTSSILSPKADAFEDYNDLHGNSTSGNEVNLAMKSIHLSRVTEDAFVQELKNEIHILRSLDHPHIVRAIETFEHRNQIFIVMVGPLHILTMPLEGNLCVLSTQSHTSQFLYLLLHRNFVLAATCMLEIPIRRKRRRASQARFSVPLRTCTPRMSSIAI